MLISASKFSYYNLVKAKENENSKKLFLFPEDVKLIESNNLKFVQMFFDEEIYGINSYSFGQYLAGNDIMLFKTKFRKKTCACKTSGTFFNGYFIIIDNNIFQIETDKKQNVKNKTQLYSFFENNSELGLPKNIDTITDIIEYLKNINN
jgi:hypothetical protein